MRSVIDKARADADTPGRVLAAAWPRTWAKIVHLIFLPLLDATRPWQLRYALGDGLLGVCRIAYRFDTIERALGELKHLQVGDALRQSLCRAWVQTLVGTDEPLQIYVDAHLKPHWTHWFMPCGHLPLLGRVMPCTRQVLVTNPAGYVWEILDRVGDASLTRELPSLEQELERVTQHRVTLTVVDREANSLELAQIYAQSDHFALLTLLDTPVSAGLEVGTPEFAEVFRLTGRWQPLTTEPAQSLAPAVWAPAREAEDDPRVLWLVRDDPTLSLRAVYALSQPVADCAPEVAAGLRGSGARTTYRRRWTASENVIRELVGGGNLNANYGYEVQEVPNRLRQHQHEEAQAQVATTENQLTTAQRQWETLTAQHTEREQARVEQLAELTTARTEREAEGTARQQAGQSTRRVEQQLAHLERDARTRRDRHVRRAEKFERQTQALAVRQAELETKLAERQAALAAIRLRVTEPMFERDLEKDQIMANFQAALLNAHRWCCDRYFTGEWSHLELETATARIYRQRGHVIYTAEQVDVTLAAFAYRAEHELAEAACGRFNAAQVHDAEGRLIVMAVASFEHCVRQL